MPFKWLPCCASGKENQGAPYSRVSQDADTASPSDKSNVPLNESSPAAATGNLQSPNESQAAASPPEVRKSSLKFAVNSIAEKLLLGQVPVDAIQCCRSIRLNVYGVPGKSHTFSSIFYSQILPQLESVCQRYDYEIDLSDISASYCAATAIFYSQVSDFRKLVSCQPYKKGFYRNFNLIILPDASLEDDVLTPVFSHEDFDSILKLLPTEAEKSDLKNNFESHEGCMQLRSDSKVEHRRDVIRSVRESIAKFGSDSMREKYPGSTFESIVNYLFAHCADVRENTCVLNMSTEDSGEQSVAVRTLANKIRSQLPDTNFIDMDQSVLESTKGKSVVGVLSSMIECFCSQHERLTNGPFGLPPHLHNELLTHNSYLEQLFGCRNVLGVTNSLDTSQKITLVHSANDLHRKLTLASLLKELREKNNTLSFFRFCGLTACTYTAESMMHSLCEQICYTDGTHPSSAVGSSEDQSNSSRLVQLLNALAEYASCDIYVALDGLRDLSWLPAETCMHDRVHILLFTTPDVSCQAYIPAPLPANDDLEIRFLRHSFRRIFKDASEVPIEQICSYIEDNLPVVKVAMPLLSKFPLSFSEGELRKCMEMQHLGEYSLDLNAILALLSPLVVRSYSILGTEYRMIPCGLSTRFDTNDAVTILERVDGTSSPRLLFRCLDVAMSQCTTQNSHLKPASFPNIQGLQLEETDQNGPLNQLGKLIHLVTPPLFIQYMKIQEKGDYPKDYELFLEALKSSFYALSLATHVTYKSELYRIFHEKSTNGELNTQDHPFCSKVYDSLSKCAFVAKQSQPSFDENDKFRPNKIKLMATLGGGSGSNNFVVVLLEHSQPSKGDPNGRVDVVRVSDLQRVRSIDMKGVPVEAKFIDPLNAVVNSERTLKVINLDEGKLRVQLKGSLNVDFPVYGIQSENQVVVLSRNRMYVNGIEISTNKQNFSFKVGEDRFLNSLLVNPNGAYVACGDAVQKPMPLLIWDLQQKILIHDIRIPDHEFDMSLAMAAELYCAVVVKHIQPDALNFVNVYEFQSSYNKYNFHEDSSVTALAFTPKGTHLLLGLADCSVVIHYLGMSTPSVYLKQLHKTPVDLIRYNIDATVLISCSLKHPFNDRTINLISIEGQLLGTYTPQCALSCIEVSPCGQAFLAGTDSSAAIMRIQFGGGHDASAAAGDSGSIEETYGNADLCGQHFAV